MRCVEKIRVVTSAQKELAKEVHAVIPTEPWRHSKCQEQRAGKELPSKHGGSPAPSSPSRGCLTVPDAEHQDAFVPDVETQ